MSENLDEMDTCDLVDEVPQCFGRIIWDAWEASLDIILDLLHRICVEVLAAAQKFQHLIYLIINYSWMLLTAPNPSITPRSTVPFLKGMKCFQSSQMLLM